MSRRTLIVGKSIYLVFFIIAVAFIIEKMSAKPSQTEMAMHQPITEIVPGIEGAANIKNQGFEIRSHPSGVYIYTKSWSDPNARGVVKLSYGKNSFKVDNVRILTGLGDNSFPENGVDNWSLSLGLGREEIDSYEGAREKIMALLGRLRAAGWKRYVEGSDPRLSGKEAVVYALSSSAKTYSLDSTYTPTVDEWRQLVAVEPTWEFYFDSIFINLTVSYWRSNIPDMGRYLVNVKISTAADNYSPYFSDDDDDKKRHWKMYLTDRLAPVRNERTIVEAKLDPRKFTIDTSYQPPPFEAPDFSAKAAADASH